MSILGMTSYVKLFLVFECIVSGFFVVFTFPLTELKSEEESLGAAGSSDCTTGPRDRIKERKAENKGRERWRSEDHGRLFWMQKHNYLVIFHLLSVLLLSTTLQSCPGLGRHSFYFTHRKKGGLGPLRASWTSLQGAFFKGPKSTFFLPFYFYFPAATYVD